MFTRDELLEGVDADVRASVERYVESRVVQKLVHVPDAELGEGLIKAMAYVIAAMEEIERRGL